MKKENLPEIGAPICEGSKVMVVDGSYSLIILNKSKRLAHESIGLSNDVWTVVAINIPCPTEESITDSLIPYNNCIISNDDGDIAFVSRINIRNIRSLF